jgi:hypothetical protein
LPAPSTKRVRQGEQAPTEVQVSVYLDSEPIAARVEQRQTRELRLAQVSLDESGLWVHRLVSLYDSIKADMNSSTSFDDAKLKLARARKHFRVLKQEIEEYLGSHPYSLYWDSDEVGVNKFLRATVSRSPPAEWGAIIGDFAHNVRSALDSLTYQLALGEQTYYHKISRDTAFPISNDESLYKSSSGRMLKSLHPRHQAQIYELQPFNNLGENDPLWWLQDLNNSDKHRVINAAAGFPANASVGLPARGWAVVQAYTLAAMLLDGAPILWLHYDDPVAARETAPSVHIEAEILFAEGSERVFGKPVLPTLNSILRRVEGVVRRLRPSLVRPPGST